MIRLIFDVFRTTDPSYRTLLKVLLYPWAVVGRIGQLTYYAYLAEWAFKNKVPAESMYLFTCVAFIWIATPPIIYLYKAIIMFLRWSGSRT